VNISDADTGGAVWSDRRTEVMLDPGVVQLNAGTCSPTPRALFERVTELRRRQAESPTEFQWRAAWPLFRRSREALGAYLSAGPAHVALVENVTVAVNIALRSIDLPAGSEVLTSDHEYGSMVSLLHRLASERGWTVRVAGLPTEIVEPWQILRTFDAAWTDRTRLVFFSHVSSPSGLIFPAGELCKLARERGAISVVDGAHGPGQIPLDLTALDADFYGANCHKWMMAPASVGFLHAGPRVKANVRSVVHSWGHGYEPGDLETEAFPGTTRWQYDLEFHGTSDRTPQMVLADAVAFRQAIGGDDAVRARVRALTGHLRARLAESGLRAFLPHDERLVGTLTAFVLPPAFQSGGAFIASPADSPAARLQKRLWDNHRIECPATHAAGTVFLRVSTAWFNSFAEIDRLVEALRGALP
jgi:isopenicillin-N epimerase